MAVCSEYIGMNSEHLDPNNLEEIKPLRNQLDLSEWKKKGPPNTCTVSSKTDPKPGLEVPAILF